MINVNRAAPKRGGRHLRFERLERRALLAAHVVMMDAEQTDEFEDSVRAVVESAIEQVIESSDQNWDPVTVESNRFEVPTDGDPIRVSTVVMQFDDASRNQYPAVIEDPQDIPTLYFTLVMYSNQLAALRAASDPPHDFFLQNGFSEPDRVEQPIAMPSDADTSALVTDTQVVERSAENVIDPPASFVDLAETAEMSRDASSETAPDSSVRGRHESTVVSESGFDEATDAISQTPLDDMLPVTFEGDSLFFSQPTIGDALSESNAADRIRPPQSFVDIFDRVVTSEFTGHEDWAQQHVPPGMLPITYSPSHTTVPSKAINHASFDPSWLLQTFVGWTFQPAVEGTTPGRGAEVSTVDRDGSPASDFTTAEVGYSEILVGWMVATLSYVYSTKADDKYRLRITSRGRAEG